MEETDKNEDREFIETIMIPLWERWQHELIESGESGKYPTKIFSEHYGAESGSIYSLMFLAFCGGLDKGADIINTLEELPIVAI